MKPDLLVTELAPSGTANGRLPALPDEMERVCLVLDIARRDRRIARLRERITAEEAEQQQVRLQVDARIGGLRRDIERLSVEIGRLESRLERLVFARRALSDSELDDEEHAERVEDAAFWAEWRQQRDERRPTIVPPRPRGNEGESLRQLYRALARLIHPDLAPGADERSRREAVMRLANAAYEAGDTQQLQRLLKLWAKPEAGEHVRSLDILRARVSERDVEEAELRGELQVLQESQIGRLMRRPKAEISRYIKREEERLRRETATLRLRRRRLLTQLEDRRRGLAEVSD